MQAFLWFFVLESSLLHISIRNKGKTHIAIEAIACNHMASVADSLPQFFDSIAWHLDEFYAFRDIEMWQVKMGVAVQNEDLYIRQIL